MSDSHPLEGLGCTGRWQALFAPHAEAGLILGRVVRGSRGVSLVATADDLLRTKVAASLRKGASGAADFPVVGDWVGLRAEAGMDRALIEVVLERQSAIMRGDPGGAADVQVLAANVDIVFVVHPVADAPNLRRIERELSLAWDSGAVPVVVLTKIDLSADADAALTAVDAIAPGVDVVAKNALQASGLEDLRARLLPNRTAVLLGPSGAGKSTLLNGLLGADRQATRSVRMSDGRGRHTTVMRELVRLPGGGVLIDTPGLRSLGLTGSEGGIDSAFSEIAELAEGCRFADCTHDGEPGCAVQAAVDAGELPADRLASYLKLIREAQVMAARSDQRLRAEEERKSKAIGKARREYNDRYRGR